jgi:tRNA(His) 5'-end guanylyltransferase
MPPYDDMLGEEQMDHEAVESLRRGSLGEPIVVRVEGTGFQAFARQANVFDWPHDERLAEAMDAATIAVVDELKCALGHTHAGEATFVFWNPDEAVACDGAFQELATLATSIVTDVFNDAGRELFPDAFDKGRARFKATAHGLPSLELAARYFDWRERQARKNAVLAAARGMFKQTALDGRSRHDMKDMMAEQAGLDFDAHYPERFRRGAFFRRMKFERHLTEEELARIPQDRRPTGPVMRSSVRLMEDVPPLVLIDNLVGFVFHKEDPVVLDLPFAASVAL